MQSIRVATPRGVKTFRTHPSADRKTIKLTTYNVRSVCTEERLESFFNEIAQVHFDFLILTETWRPDVSETWVSKQGHYFFGAGGMRGKRGTAFILRKRWTYKSFSYISERAARLDCVVGGLTVRIISSYFPHAGHSEDVVFELYDVLSCQVREARNKNMACIIAGDFNAVVGARQDDDCSFSIGPFGLGN